MLLGTIRSTGFRPVWREATAARSYSAPTEGLYGQCLTEAAVVFLVAFLMVGSAGCSRSESLPAAKYPERPIKLVVPFSAGGGTDTFARIVKRAFDDNDLLPQPLVIINRGGAGATVGSRSVKDAEPDGYSLLILHEAIMTAQHSGKVDYGVEDFEPIAATGEMGMVIAVADTSPHEDLHELLSAAQQRPDELKFGVNMGALTHFVGLQLEQMGPGARFRFAQIGGGAERFADLKGGHIDATGFSLEEFVRFRSEGLKGLAYLGEARHPAIPDVPTAREQGLDLLSSNTFYWWLPQGTPTEVQDTLADALQAAMETEYLKRKLADIHCDPIYLRDAPLRRRIRQRDEEIARLALKANVSGREVVKLPPLPAMTLAVAGILVVPVVVGSWRQLRRERRERQALSTADEPRPRADLAAIVALLTCGYAAALAVGVDFRISTLVFVLAAGGCLARIKPWWFYLVLLATALLMSQGLFLLFTRIFVVDLP